MICITGKYWVLVVSSHLCEALGLHPGLHLGLASPGHVPQLASPFISTAVRVGHAVQDQDYSRTDQDSWALLLMRSRAEVQPATRAEP